jgi:hypothetical protein
LNLLALAQRLNKDFGARRSTQAHPSLIGYCSETRGISDHPRPETNLLLPVIRQSLLARCKEDSAVLEPLLRLELAIEIERRETELARLKAAKAEIKATRSSATRRAHSRAAASGTPTGIPEQQLAAVRAAVSIGRATAAARPIPAAPPTAAWSPLPRTPEEHRLRH